MSVILDALKKLDREKSYRRNGTPEIAVEILRPDLHRHRKGFLPYIAAVSFATAGIAYLLMMESGFISKSPSLKPLPPLRETLPGSSAPREFVPPSKPSLSQPSKSPAPAETVSSPSPGFSTAPDQTVIPAPPDAGSLPKASPPAPPSLSAPIQPESPTPAIREPVREIQDRIGPVPTKIQSHAGGVNVAASPDEKETGQKVISEGVKFAPAKAPMEEPLAAPSIRISGIVWSEVPSRRLAVINGIALTEGALIEEVKVMEIYPTRVRFSHQGRPFEIHLGSTAVIK